MAVCVYTTTRAQRRAMTGCIKLLNILQCIVGLTLFLTGLIVIKHPTNVFSQRSEITFVFSVICIYGVVIIYHLVINGWRICRKSSEQCYKKSTANLLRDWTISSTVIVISGTVLASQATRVCHHIVRGINNSLKKGMTKYTSNATWKFTIDKLQQDVQCCGVDSYEDWYRISWLSLDSFKSAALKNYTLESTDQFFLPILPWSCCRIDYGQSCYHDRMQQWTLRDYFDENESAILESIYQTGCLITLRFPVELGFKLFEIADIVLIFIQIINIILLRLVFTSSTYAILLGDPDGIAPATFILSDLNTILQERSLEKLKVNIIEKVEQDQELEEKFIHVKRKKGGGIDFIKHNIRMPIMKE